MKHLLFTLLILTIPLFGSVKQQMLQHYKQKEYLQVCKVGYKNFHKYSKDENFISLYAFGCLYADYIDRLAVPTVALRFTKEGRSNAAYFSVILMQKKLLYHAMLDGVTLSEMKLPTTNYILSKVFDYYTKAQKQGRESYIFTDEEDPKKQYKLYLERTKKAPKIVIEEYLDGLLQKRHIYW